MSIQENERIAEAFVASWGSHDAGQTVAFLAEGATWLDVTGSLLDRSAMRAYVQGWDDALPDLSARVVGKVASEDQVAAEIEFTGTNTGPMQMGAGAPAMPPTGKSVRGKGTFFARIRDGKIVELHTYPDLAGVMMQLGTAPA
jgi:steroid delta-isomerase-like uncharacterized protein